MPHRYLADASTATWASPIDFADIELSADFSGAITEYGAYEAAERPAGVPEGSYRFLISSGQPNRRGDRIITAGIDYDEYLKNPVLLWMHDPCQVIGRVHSIERKGDALYAWLSFDEADELSKTVRARVELGTIRACSVGIGIRKLERDETRAPAGHNINESELFELSIVAVPCNPKALRTNFLNSGISAAPPPDNLAAIASRCGWHGDPMAFFQLSADQIAALRPELTLATLAEMILEATDRAPLMPLCAQMGVAPPWQAETWSRFEAALNGSADRDIARRCAAAAGLELANWIPASPPAAVVAGAAAGAPSSPGAQVFDLNQLILALGRLEDAVSRNQASHNAATVRATGSAP